MIRHPNRNRKTVDTERVKTCGVKKVKVVNFTVQYKIPANKTVDQRFYPNWMNTWLKHSCHESFDQAVRVYLKEMRAHSNYEHRLLDAEGKPISICDICKEPHQGLLCNHSFFDFITKELVHD